MSSPENERSKKLRNFDLSRIVDSEQLVLNVVFPFESKITGEPSDVWIPESRLEGKNPSEIRTLAERTYEAFRRAEEWEKERNVHYADEKSVEAAKQLYKAVLIIVTANCAAIYVDRLEEGNEEAKAEEKFLESLAERSNADIDSETLVNAAMESAEVLFNTWIKDDEKYIAAFTENLNFWVGKHIAAAAILQTDEEIDKQGSADEVWDEAFWRHYKEEIDGVKSLFLQYAYKEAADILENELKPVEMPFERLRLWAGVTWLEGMVKDREPSDQLTPKASGGASVTRKLAEYVNGPLTSREESFMKQFHTYRNGSYNLTHAHSRPDLPRGTPGTGHRITSAQMDLMIYILLSSYENLEGERPVVWSPKAYLKRSPTKSEAAALSRRVSTLAYHGLIKRSEREVSITDYGKALIRAYTVERNYDKNLSSVKLVLELNETWKSIEALRVVSDAARRHGRHDLVRRDGRGPLHDLFFAEMDRKDSLIQQLKDNATQQVQALKS